MDELIESGSLTPGIDVSDFHLPPESALRCERPDTSVERYVSAYFVMDSTSTYSTVQRAGIEWMLPTWGQIWVVFAKNAIEVRIGPRRYARLYPVALYGPTSRAMPVQAQGGASIGIELTPLGWAALVGQSAYELRDQLVPLQGPIGETLAAALLEALESTDRALSIKPVLDAFFGDATRTPHVDEEGIASLTQAISDPDIVTTAAASEASGLSSRVAERIARQHMGFPIKTLLVRRRFLCAMAPALLTGTLPAVPDGYYDRSHFLRDARRYLGMTPRAYLAQKSVYVAAVCRARTLVIGTPLATMLPPKR